MTIHELYGLLAEKHEREIAEHRKTIGVLAGLKTGTIRLDQLTVDAATGQWSVTAEATEPLVGQTELQPQG